MKPSSLLAAAAAAAAVLLAAPAGAQDKLVNMPAEKFITAPGGVDMRTGRFVYNETDLTIGGEGSQGLSLSRILTANVLGHANPFANLSHNWDIMVSELRINIDDPQSAGQDYQINVHFGGRSQTYQSRYSSIGYQQMSPGAWAPLTFVGDRASAGAVYTYTAADGAVALFRPIGQGDCSGSRRCAFVSEITEPDGTKFTFSYAATGASGGAMRLAGVTSSRGYALLLEGSGNVVTRACVLNTAQTPAPASGLCPAGVPTATYGYAGGRLVSATGPDNATSSFTYAATATGGTAMGFVKPGQSAPWLTNIVHNRPDELEVSQEIVDRQDFADGQSYIYAYHLSPAVPNKPQTIAGGTYTNALNQRTLVKYAWPLAPGQRYANTPCTSLPCAPFTKEEVYNRQYQQTPGPVSITDPLNRTTRFDYCDAAAMAGLPSYEPNRCIVLQNPQYVIDPEGIRTDLAYDGNGNAKKATRIPKAGVPNPDGSTPAPIVTSAVYVTSLSKAANKPLSTTDARGNTTTWTYAPEHGGATSESGPAVNGVTPQKRYSYVQRYARPGNGPPVWLLDRMSLCRTGNPASGGSGCALGAADEVVTTYDYGPDSGANNLLLRGQAVSADGQTLRTCYAYDSLGRRISETGPGGTAGLAACPASAPASAAPFTSSTRYDSAGQVTGTIGPDPDGAGPLGHPAVRNGYDPAGRLVKVEEGTLAAWQPDGVAPAYWPGFAVHKIVDTSYDALDRKTREAVRGTGATASVTEYGYDLAGRLKCTAVRMNPDAWAAPLADKCVPGPAHGLFGQDRISQTVYDAAGQPLETWDAVGSALARREAAWSYNLNGQKTSLTDARGFRAEMTYDGFGRQQRWIFPSKATPGLADQNDFEEYAYDNDGNRIAMRKRDGSVLSFHYDALDRMTAKIVPERAGLTAAQTRDVYYQYDNRGLQTRARFDHIGGEGVTTAYDGFGRVTSSTLAMAGTSRTLGHQYDASGNRIRITHPDGAFFTHEYDGLGRFLRVRENGGDPLATATYDFAGRPARTGWAATTDHAYDPAGRLSGLTHDLVGTGGDQVIGLTYNPASQILSRSGTNDAFAWTGAKAVNRPYSVNGQNQYTAAGGASFAYDANGNLVSDGASSFVYDVENRLVAASGEKTASLVYDPLGRLFQTSGGAAGITQFLYDDDALIGEYDAGGYMVHRYIHGPAKGVDDPLIWYHNAAAGWRRALVADQQGSVIAVADMYGNPFAINAYDEYGIPDARNQGRFQYTGQAWIPELGMYYYKARIYSPTLGRFLQVDPIGYDDQINLYAYVGNDPLNGSDPTGESCERSDGSICGFARDFFVGDIEDAVANPTPVTIGMAVLTTVFKPAKVVDKVVDGARAAGRAKRAGETAERVANRTKSEAQGIPQREIGPSGKRKVHVREHSSLKRAEDSAQSRSARGQAPMRHANPKRGDPHFHATDAKGKKRPDGVHESYSRRGYPKKDQE